jgi:hypothetical protein
MIPDLTFEPSALQIPIRSQRPMKYRPKFTPPWSPEIPWKPTTSVRIFHFLFFTSIQWAVIPKNEALVLSADHPSAVVEIFPGAAWCPVSVFPTFICSNTYNDITLQFFKPVCKLVMNVNRDIVSGRYIRFGGSRSHRNQTVFECCLVRNC